MATIYLPLIRKEDFETFKRLLGPNLPDTYDGWRQLVTDRGDMLIEERQQVVMKEVDPDEFADWIQDGRARGHTQRARYLRFPAGIAHRT